MHRMTPDWPYTLNCQKGPVYTEYSPRGTIFIPFLSTVARFQITEGLGFPKGYKGEIQKFMKNRLTKI